MNSIVSTASLAGAAAIVSQNVAATPVLSDSALLDLCRALQREWAELRRLDAKNAHAENDECYREIEPQFHRVNALAERIEKLPAKTFDGLAVKALAVWFCHSGEQPIELNDEQTTDIRLCQSILSDLLAGFGYGATAQPELSVSETHSAVIQDDPIFVAIDAHRIANAEYEKAALAADRAEGRPRKAARIFIGYYDAGKGSLSENERGIQTYTWTLTGKKKRIYATCYADIERNVPKDLRGNKESARAWIKRQSLRLDAKKRRIAEEQALTEYGKLEAASDKAYDIERDQMWNLIWTEPTTLAGLATLLAYFRDGDDINLNEELQAAHSWSIECAVCSFAGLPKPPMSEIVSELWNEQMEEEAAA